MKVILLKDVKGKGYRGDVVEVSDGYANNFLFPQALGVIATPEALQTIAAQAKRTAKESSRAEMAAQRAAAALDGTTLTIPCKANEDGTLYAAVSEKEVLKAAKTANVSLKAAKIVFLKPIKETGAATIMIEFVGGYEAEVTLIVEAMA